MQKADGCRDCAFWIEVRKNTHLTELAQAFEQSMQHQESTGYSLEIVEDNGKLWACFKHER